MSVRRGGAGALGLLAAVSAAGCGAATPPTPHHAADRAPRHAAAARSSRLRVLSTRVLPAPVQLPGLARVGGRVLAAGGLNASDTSVAGVVRVAPGRPRAAGSLPSAVHDVAATTLGSSMYVFGGGSSSGPTDAVTRVSASGRRAAAGHLPVALSDASAVTGGSTAYVRGGYTTTPPPRPGLPLPARRPGRRAAPPP